MLRRVVVMLALGSVLLTACGGGGDNASSATGGGGTTATTGGGGATSTTGGGTTATTGGGTAGSADCAQAAAAMAAAAQALPDAFTGTATDLNAQLQELRAFADAAPDEIKADLQTILDGYSKIVDALNSSGYDPTSGQAPPPEVIAALTQVGQQLDSADFKAAVQHVNDYFSSCQ
jgi:hypothetical protein